MIRSTRTASRLAWASWACTLAFALAGVALTALSRAAPVGNPFPRGVGVVWGLLLAMAFATVGALVAARRPGNLIAWTFLLAGLTGGFGLAAQA